MEDILIKILELSDYDHLQSAEDCQYALEEIYDLIKTNFPDLEKKYKNE